MLTRNLDVMPIVSLFLLKRSRCAVDCLRRKSDTWGGFRGVVLNKTIDR